MSARESAMSTKIQQLRVDTVKANHEAVEFLVQTVVSQSRGSGAFFAPGVAKVHSQKEFVKQLVNVRMRMRMILFACA